MPTPLSAAAALLVTFLAARVWPDVYHETSHVAQEARTARETIFLADALPRSLRDAVRGGFGEHPRFVEAEDWPAMAAGDATLRTPPRGIADTPAALFWPGPTLWARAGRGCPLRSCRLREVNKFRYQPGEEHRARPR